MNPLSMHRTLGSLTLRNGIHEAYAFHNASVTLGDIACCHILERRGPDVVNYVQRLAEILLNVTMAKVHDFQPCSVQVAPMS
jgi:hypothetical protein